MLVFIIGFSFMSRHSIQQFCRIGHQENANDIILVFLGQSLLLAIHAFWLLKTTSSLTPANLYCEIGNFIGQNSILGHPIGATGLAQCAEIIYQVNIYLMQ